jgi:glycosyltransferase involved in cell wall biosynthesis
MIERLAAEHEAVHGIKLSRNRGHQNALIAGLQNTPGDAVISVDADLQDDISVIETMIDRFQEGHEIVYGVRNDRGSDSLFKRFSAEGYYRLLRMMGVEAVTNHADYRLLSRRALECLREYREVNLFLRGIVPLLGFRSTKVTYARNTRFAGESKYPLRKMIRLAIDGITSFSALPLRLITLTGLFVFVASILIVLWALWIRLYTDMAIPGWASTVIPFYFLGGVQLFCTGVIGEYMAKIYIEIKARPRYHIEKEI